MQTIKLWCVFFVLFLHGAAFAGIFLEKPKDFHPKPAIVGGCFLHHKDEILLLHRQNSKAEGNRWGIPGGKLNKDEPLFDAISREVFEETGFQLNVENIHYIGKVYIKVPNFDFEYHMVSYLEDIKNPADVKINIGEHKGFTWVTPEDALKMDLMTDEDTCFEIVFGLGSTSMN
ncbi:MAG TPA: NUDIX hydrolase [Parachlamydiaceae bacterium]|nr:NUDIX hydrolase [Parachlamydiaceae bacterium]